MNIQAYISIGYLTRIFYKLNIHFFFFFCHVETNKRILLEWDAKKARCSEELLLIVEDMKSYLTYYTALIGTLKSKKDDLPESVV